MAVNAGAVACPFAPVTAVADDNTPKVPVALEAGAVNVTVTPDTGLLCESSTVATSALVNAVLMAVVCGVPLVAVIDAGLPALFVSANEARVETPETLAVAVKAPAVKFAVNAAEVACPFVPVETVELADPPKLAPAPELGMEKVTLPPETGLPAESFTVATRAFPKAEPTVALCGVPLVATMDAGAAAVLVRAKLIDPEIPGAVAVTE